jgi:hypothetical protein
MLEAVAHSLKRAAAFNPDDVTRPAAVLWTDPKQQWLPIIPDLRNIVPVLITLGDYNPSKLTGPSIWVRAAIEGRLEDVNIKKEDVPVIYLPGISRQTLRAAYECPANLQPLIELQYRGVSWIQKNGRDWSVEAFMMSSDGGLALDLATDEATKYALGSAISEVAVTPLSKLRGKRLEASDFNALLTSDFIKDVLSWLNNPNEIKDEWPKPNQKAFRSQMKSELAVDPESDGALAAAEKLGSKVGDWQRVWDRFTEAPGLYPGIIDLLYKAAPAQLDAFADESSWPGRNATLEDQLREDLKQVSALPENELRTELQKLEDKHGCRREWVWAKLGQAPLSISLLHLMTLMERTKKPLAGQDVQELADDYETSGWMADWAVVQALRVAGSSGDRQAVTAVIQAVYTPWIDESARRLQALLDDAVQLPQSATVDVGDGGVILFSDGLRFDVSQRLHELLEEQGFNVSLTGRWTALPTVTATGKPAVSPIAGLIKGNCLGEKFAPDVEETGKEVTTARFRKLLLNAGFQYLGVSDTGDPSGKAWTEHSDLDSMGHKLQVKLVDRVEEELRFLRDRVAQLFEAGWKEVRIVTDHGWLLAPGGLPKKELPHFLAKSRWARCASIKDDSKVDVPIVQWFWNNSQWAAVGPGVHCFSKGNVYAHGGVSMQECRIPDLRVTPGEVKELATAAITGVKWLGFRCQVTVENPPTGGMVEIRLKTEDAGSSLTEPKAITEDNTVKLLVADDEYEGSPAVIVILDGAGHVIAKTATMIGGEGS